MEDDLILESHGLTKIYSSRNRTIRAVDDVDLRVRRGEIFSLLGPNGAGKTTMVRMITTLESPTEGELLVDGVGVGEDAGRAREKVGLVPQEVSLYDKLTAQETLEMMGSLYGVPEDLLRERIDDIIELVGLEGRRDDLVKGFSGGMKQRLSLGSGLVHHPEILILDEPTTGLDPQTRRRLWQLIRELNDEGVTMFINTHIMEEAETLSDRVGVMNEGKLVEVDTPDNLKRLVEGGEVVNVCLKPEDRQKSTEVLEGDELVLEINETEDGLKVITENRNKALTRLPNVLSAEGIDVEEIGVVEPTLEDVFIQITGD